jgi:hypothetical protein
VQQGTANWYKTLKCKTHTLQPGSPYSITKLGHLTLILLTWTKWRAPINASKWRMGFNSAFKGLRVVCLGLSSTVTSSSNKCENITGSFSSSIYLPSSNCCIHDANTSAIYIKCYLLLKSNKHLLLEVGYEMIHTGLIFSNKDRLCEKQCHKCSLADCCRAGFKKCQDKN